MAWVNRPGSPGKNIGVLQAYFAIMGGIAKVEIERGKVKPSYTATRELGWTTRVALERERERELSIPQDPYQDPYQPTRAKHLTPLRFDRLLEKEYVEMIRQFSIYEIGVISKQDALATFIVCLQAVRTLTGSLGRTIQRLPISPLESHTAICIANLIVMYAVWWAKPVDLGRPILLSLMQDYKPDSEIPRTNPSSSIATPDPPAISRVVEDFIDEDQEPGLRRRTPTRLVSIVVEDSQYKPQKSYKGSRYNAASFISDFDEYLALSWMSKIIWMGLMISMPKSDHTERILRISGRPCQIRWISYKSWNIC